MNFDPPTNNKFGSIHKTYFFKKLLIIFQYLTTFNAIHPACCLRHKKKRTLRFLIFHCNNFNRDCSVFFFYCFMSLLGLNLSSNYGAWQILNFEMTSGRKKKKSIDLPEVIRKGWIFFYVFLIIESKVNFMYHILLPNNWTV